MTNRQWLQTLTDEELAKWHWLVGCGMCAHNPQEGFCEKLLSPSNYDQHYCFDGIAKWLQQEHKEN